jgi:hypothetical protein
MNNLLDVLEHIIVAFIGILIVATSYYTFLFISNMLNILIFICSLITTILSISIYIGIDNFMERSNQIKIDLPFCYNDKNFKIFMKNFSFILLILSTLMVAYEAHYSSIKFLFSILVALIFYYNQKTAIKIGYKISEFFYFIFKLIKKH